MNEFEQLKQEVAELRREVESFKNLGDFPLETLDIVGRDMLKAESSGTVGTTGIGANEAFNLPNTTQVLLVKWKGNTYRLLAQ